MEMSEIFGGEPAPDENAPATKPADTVDTPATPEVTAPATTAEESAARESQPRDEHGRFAPRQDGNVNEESDEQRMVPLAALKEERRKRQELEQRYQVPPPPRRPDPTDDDFYNSPVTATRQIVDPIVEEMDRKVLAVQFNMGEAQARETHSDYDQVKQDFTERLDRGDPMAVAIAQQMFGYANPPKYAYDQVKRLRNLEQVGDLDALRSRIANEERAKLLQEYAANGRPVPPRVPASLNSETSAPSSVTAGPFEPTPLSSIVKFNN